jgi:hypothetical protein
MYYYEPRMDKWTRKEGAAFDTKLITLINNTQNTDVLIYIYRSFSYYIEGRAGHFRLYNIRNYWSFYMN